MTTKYRELPGFDDPSDQGFTIKRSPSLYLTAGQSDTYLWPPDYGYNVNPDACGLAGLTDPNYKIPRNSDQDDHDDCHLFGNRFSWEKHVSNFGNPATDKEISDWDKMLNGTDSSDHIGGEADLSKLDGYLDFDRAHSDWLKANAAFTQVLKTLETEGSKNFLNKLQLQFMVMAANPLGITKIAASMVDPPLSTIIEAASTISDVMDLAKLGEYISELSAHPDDLKFIFANLYERKFDEMVKAYANMVALNRKKGGTNGSKPKTLCYWDQSILGQVDGALEASNQYLNDRKYDSGDTWMDYYH